VINCIIFSFDRALQLRNLLYSLSVNASGVFDISIIYKYSTDEYNAAYEKLKSENIIPDINWVKQSDNFKTDLLNLLDKEKEIQYTCFGTDDDILYRKFNVNEITNCLSADEDVFCFSLRLGKNTTYCYAMNATNKLIPLPKENNHTENIIKWDWQKHFFDLGYPLSVDFHIFRTHDISKLIKKVNFTNPNTLEASLQIFDSFPKYKMASFDNSVIVNTPINIVQKTFQNRNGEEYGMTAKELNDKYINGSVIDYEKLDFTSIKSPHQEIKLEFKNL